ncbi:PREDICTED: cytochrome P450 CYP72A219-like [Erythranthe guttata]|uniref:cytochrome P450 CYP72A219-like n=1 Tax=Erythranthe guttata TaxID=4155 RepID=UPI00064DAEAE|nr:PREDICTED: cytochrome P450 CYP72A219-like [Erythranthe guttata]|eukprot:XP_012850540.1 PREDICTED: cytochrome P450 CYP72A219-like [Erythranthe guttata]
MAVITLSIILTSIVVAASITWAVKLLNWVWFRPRKLEKILRQQGLNGNPYRPFLGDLGDMIKFMKAEQPKTIELFDDILPHIFAYYHQIVTKYGENSFIWFGPWPRLNVSDPELIKEILSKPDIFHKPLPETAKILIGGMLLLEGDKWSKHRKIVTPAFHLEKLKANVLQKMNLKTKVTLACFFNEANF